MLTHFTLIFPLFLHLPFLFDFFLYATLDKLPPPTTPPLLPPRIATLDCFHHSCHHNLVVGKSPSCYHLASTLPFKLNCDLPPLNLSLSPLAPQRYSPSRFKSATNCFNHRCSVAHHL